MQIVFSQQDRILQQQPLDDGSILVWYVIGVNRGAVSGADAFRIDIILIGKRNSVQETGLLVPMRIWLLAVWLLPWPDPWLP